MTITSLPDDLSITDNSSVQLYDYRTFNSLVRGKINLTKNTFSFLKEGVKEVYSNNKSVTIKNNEFLIIKSGNCLMTEKLSSQYRRYHSILLFFTDEMLLNFLEKKQVKYTSPKAPKSYLVNAYDDYIRYFVKSLEQINELNKSFQAELLQTKFEEIMTYLLQKNGVSFLNALLSHQDSKVNHFMNVIENNKYHKLTLQELAFLSNMSLSTFKRTFIQQYQISPIKWFQQQRMEHAAFLLRTLKKRPIDLYEAAGYENLSNFVKAFKKKYGVTPKQYQTQQ